MIQGGDPVGSGYVASLARPGGNITGLAVLRPELSGKRLELLKEIVPKLSRVAVFASSGSAEYALVLKEVEIAAEPLGVKLQSLDVQSPKDFETAFQAAAKGRADAVLFRVRGPVLNPHRTKIVALAVKSRLPAIYEAAEVCGSRGTDELWRERQRLGPARSDLRGQDPERPLNPPTSPSSNRRSLSSSSI